MPSELYYLCQLFRPIHFQYKECLVSPVINANRLDPDQTPHSMASDQGVNCLPMSHYRTLGLNIIKGIGTFGTFSAIFDKRDNFCDFVFALLRTSPL